MAADPSRWTAVRSLLADARERPPAERAAWLATATDDDDLRAEVASLLSADDRAQEGGFLTGPAADTASALFADAADPYLGRRVGPWRLTDLLGEGGMGVVYRAERADADFEQEAALKLIARGLAPSAVVERFRQERRILARLEHPGIARLLDGGLTDDGQPYFAMELVRGEPLAAYADARALGLRQRLALFQEVCAAVAYAHRNLVVHRDLKPSNILVASGDGGRPVVRLLDFGIATVLEDDGGARTPRTQTGAMMTPAYAAPEQVTGAAITTATDVYALGVVLYELLAGQRPYDLEPGAAPTAIERVICGPPPPPPSQAARPEHAARLRGDLDTIVLKALETDPERRYSSAQAFAEDLQRHLDGLPVSARRPTAGYRVRTFVRRHPVGVGLSALLAVALVLGMAGTTWQARVASGERDRAQTETAKAEATRDYVLGLFSAANPDSAQGRVVTVREALDLGAARVGTDLAGQPIVRADVELTIALLYRRLAVYDEARAHAETAIALRAEHLGESAPETASARRELAALLIETGDYAESRTAAQRAYDDHVAALGPTDPEALASLNVLGAALSELGEWTDAEQAFEELVAQLRALPDSSQLSEALLNLGSSRMRQQRFESGEAPLRESLAIRRDLFGRVHSSTATTMNSLALAIARGRGDMDEAEGLLTEALDIRRQLYGREHPEVAQMLNNLARFYEENGDLATAEATYDELLPLMQATLGPEHPYTGLVLINYGNLVRQRGRPAEAERYVREGHAIDRAVHGAEHPLAAESETRLAQVMVALGRHGEARRLLAHALPILEGAYDDDAPPVQAAHEVRDALP